MIKRYELLCETWCKASDVEQLEQEKQKLKEHSDHWKCGWESWKKDYEKLEQERDQLAARVERLEAAIKEFCEDDAGYRAVVFQSDLEKLLNESPTTSLQAQNKALLLRLAKVAEEECDDWRVAEWIEQKAEEL